MKQILLETLPSFLGYDFANKELIIGTDLKHKGLVEPTSKRFVGGRKIRKEFLLPSGEIAVSIDFQDVVKNEEGQFVEASLKDATHIKKHCVYYYEDNSVYAEKIEFEFIKNKKKLAKSRVEYSIDYLIDTAEQLGASSYVSFIFEGFKKGFDAWKDLANPSVFIDQLNGNNEGILVDIQQLYGTVNAPIPNFAPKTFKDALIEQLTEIKWVNPNL